VNICTNCTYSAECVSRSSGVETCEFWRKGPVRGLLAEASARVGRVEEVMTITDRGSRIVPCPSCGRWDCSESRKVTMLKAEPAEVTVTGCQCGRCDRAICELAGIDGLKRALGGTSSEWHACLALGTKWYTWDHWREWNAVQLAGATFRGPSHWVPPEPRQPSGPAIDRASAVESVERHATVAGSGSVELKTRDESRDVWLHSRQLRIVRTEGGCRDVAVIGGDSSPEELKQEWEHFSPNYDLRSVERELEQATRERDELRFRAEAAEKSLVSLRGAMVLWT
jgi:hypothetical protein